MKEINPGDEVRVINEYEGSPFGNGHIHTGDIGVALPGYNGYEHIGVLFKGFKHGHSGVSYSGVSVGSKECWEMRRIDLEIVNKVTKIDSNGNLV